jgi:glycosyltransferase involved in cell wall biosynthesis
MSARRTIHLVNPLECAAGGSELHTIALYEELKPHADVFLWSGKRPAVEFAALPIQKITAEHFPRGGALVFVGAYQALGDWIAKACPRRAIVLYNMLTPGLLVAFMRQLFQKTADRVEVVFASELLRQKTKHLRGIVELSKIDLARFVPRPLQTRDPLQPFVIGRLSRDDLRKHHPDNLEVYRQAIASGCKVRLMGATCLADDCQNVSGIELLPMLAEPAEQFLQGLDCFLYRTRSTFFEAFGRVVHEAMACALPVVCHRDGGYATSIEHGRSGFLFETSEEALEIVQRLRQNPQLAADVGGAARTTVEKLYSPAERAKVIDYFLL